MENFNILLSLAVIVAGLVFIYLGWNSYRQASKASTTWLTAPGVITKSGLKSQHYTNRRGTASTNYQPDVTYQYLVAGQTYHGDQLGFGKDSTSREKAQALIAPYPLDGPVTVHYDPANPSKSVLETKVTGGTPYIIIGVSLLVLGLLSAYILP